ncbi:MAG: hypothetical protein PUF61_03350 [Spirochaetales bacterium]|nr:hypothetical protein [Spirochaetales bacterium]
MNTQAENELAKAYELLKKSQLAKASEILSEALQDDLENKEILYTIKGINYWNQKLSRIQNIASPYDQGESIVSHWKDFTQTMSQGDLYFERSIYAIRQGIFSLARDCYESMINTSGKIQPDPDIFRKAGLCHKKLGDYETALKYLDKANSMVSDSAAILSEMADCYALCGEERTAKVLFREAFFIDPQKVDLSLLDSELIRCLIKQTEQLGYSGAVLQEWIPVYGVLYGVFSVKRELRAIEIGKLKQNIFALENNLQETENNRKEASNDRALIVPRLINHYFWLIDHYVMTNEARSHIQEVLLKIRFLDANIYEEYLK